MHDATAWCSHVGIEGFTRWKTTLHSADDASYGFDSPSFTRQKCTLLDTTGTIAKLCNVGCRLRKYGLSPLEERPSELDKVTYQARMTSMLNAPLWPTHVSNALSTTWKCSLHCAEDRSAGHERLAYQGQQHVLSRGEVRAGASRDACLQLITTQ
jgi:hypothetical protein